MEGFEGLDVSFADAYAEAFAEQAFHGLDEGLRPGKKNVSMFLKLAATCVRGDLERESFAGT